MHLHRLLATWAVDDQSQLIDIKWYWTRLGTAKVGAPLADKRREEMSLDEHATASLAVIHFQTIHSRDHEAPPTAWTIGIAWLIERRDTVYRIRSGIDGSDRIAEFADDNRTRSVPVQRCPAVMAVH